MALCEICQQIGGQCASEIQMILIKAEYETAVNGPGVDNDLKIRFESIRDEKLSNALKDARARHCPIISK